MSIKTVSFIGSGNVATHLAVSFLECGISIKQIISKTSENAKKLADMVQAEWSCEIEDIDKETDLIIISVNDDNILEVIEKLPFDSVPIVHTSGTTDLDIFDEEFQYCGVFYPLQTFSKGKPVDFSTVPIFVEASLYTMEHNLYLLARKLSPTVYKFTSEQRMILHVAAVISCNFTNHLWALSSELLKEKEISFDLLKPLLRESIQKLDSFNPLEAQTGPAVRNDRKIIEKHLELLSCNPFLAELYEKISDSIYAYSKKISNYEF